MQHEYQMQREAISSGIFSDPDPSRCPCNGSGWIISSFDTWESCPCHSGPHPEDMIYAEEEYRAHSPSFSVELWQSWATPEDYSDKNKCFYCEKPIDTWCPDWDTNCLPF